MITATPITMSGVFAPLAEEFVSFKRAQGYKYYFEAKVLSCFCRFTQQYELAEPILSKELAMDWTAPREGEAAKSRLHRVSILNQFGKYLELTGHEVCALPSRNWNQGSFTPYIFTHDEMGRLFQAADNIRPIAQARDLHKELPVLFRLLYSCGLRVSESVGLRCWDVDLEKGILTIREAKNGRDRLIPLSESLQKLLRAYREDTAYWLQEDDFFFLLQTGRSSVRTPFTSGFVKSCGLPVFHTTEKEMDRACMIFVIHSRSIRCKGGWNRARI